MNQTRPVTSLVVVGSSAGGIDALSVLVASLPEDFPAPIVIAQHLDPNRPSQLEQILARRSTLPVRTVTSQIPLQAGTVYVVPANRHVSISDHAIELSNDTERPMPSVDLLLASAAESFGEALIAVILTGTGSDGANGARIVHEAGGVVIIQNPDEAEFPGMPRALAPSTVDLVTHLANIGPVLSNLLGGMDPASLPDERRALEAFLIEVRERFGMDFSNYKTPTIRRRLQRRIVATDSGTLAGYIGYLDRHPEEYPKLLDSFLIKVTEFFRDPELFAYLREHVLPPIIEHARAANQEIRIWSAGCATGEEAYSLAIAVAEALGDELDLFDVRIFGTDADASAINYARVGAYPARALTGLPEDLIARYFTQEAGTYYVRKRIRSMVVFGEHDLGRRAPFPRIDLVLCRNVLIYFTPQLQQHVLRGFAFSLQDEGFLVLGKAETTSLLPEYFQLEDPKLRVYRRRGDRMVVPAMLATPLPAYPPRARVPDWMGGQASPSRLPAVAPPQAPGLANNDFLLSLPLGVVVVNRSYDIQAINAAARSLLRIHTAAIGEDLIHTARHLPYAEIRDAIDSAFRDGAQSVIAALPIDDAAASEPRYLKLTCYPRSEQQPTELVVIVIDDVTEIVRERQELRVQLASTTAAAEEAGRDAATRLRQVQSDAAAERERRQGQIERLLQTNREITEANQELTRLIEELRARNEELMLMTEEAQAATEEVETLNEELQASNEELETLNEELQATVEELNTTNDELQSRTSEVQQLAQASELERGRLEMILRSLADAVLVVDRAGRVELANEAARRIFGGPEREEGTLSTAVLLDHEGQELAAADTPQQLAARGQSFELEFTARTPEGDIRFYEATGGPIGGSGAVEGGVVVVRDITDRSLRRLQDEFLVLANHELRAPLTVLQSSIQMILRQLDRHPDDRDALRARADTALTQARQLGRLIGDLVNATRLQSGKYHLMRQPLRLDELVAHLVEAVRETEGGPPIELAPSEPLTVNADAGRLEQVVLNLLENAKTYAPDSERIAIRLSRAGEWARIEVEDDGPGIPAAELPHIFTRFYQVQQVERPARGGLGLGLYISREIVQAHGGQIEVASVEGQGTAFTVLLPLAEQEEPGEQR